MNTRNNDVCIPSGRRDSNTIQVQPQPQFTVLQCNDLEAGQRDKVNQRQQHWRRRKFSNHFRWLGQCGQLLRGCSRKLSPASRDRTGQASDRGERETVTRKEESVHSEPSVYHHLSANCWPGPNRPSNLNSPVGESNTITGTTVQNGSATNDTTGVECRVGLGNAVKCPLVDRLLNSTCAASRLSEADLSRTLRNCEKRIEFLYNRLTCLDNVHYLTGSVAITQSEGHVCQHKRSQSNMIHFDQGDKNNPSEVTQDRHCNCSKTWEAMEKHLARLTEKIRSLKSQVDTISYLSWLGIIEAPNGNRIVNPGHCSPLPNPQQHLIRRSDSDTRCTIQEFKSLCKHPLTDKLRMDLRSSTFNNWPWSDAWLIRLVEQMYHDLDLVAHFDLSLARLHLWLCDVYRRYNRVPFHNYKHAFMVAQMCYSIIWTASLDTILDKEEQLTLITSAICHDLDHPGFNNAYQINAGTVLAMRYNDQSPLESHHAAVAFDILSHDEVNPFSGLPPVTWRRIRDGIIKCILATDMSRHNEILNQFNNTVIADVKSGWSIDAETGKPQWVSDKTQRDLAMMIILKTCDISNEARPLHVAGPWINRLLAEFFHQSDFEKVSGLPVAPFMDRDKVTKSASQCGFIRFVILPLFESLAKLLPSLEVTILQSAKDQLDFYTKMKIEEEKQALPSESSPTEVENSPVIPDQANDNQADVADCDSVVP